MSNKNLVDSTPLTKLFREMSLDERRAVYLRAAQGAIESQRRVMDHARKDAAERSALK